MPCFHLIPVACRPLDFVIDAHFGPSWSYNNKMNISPLQPTRTRINCIAFYLRNLCHAFGSCSLTKVQASGTLQLGIGKDEPPDGGHHIHGGNTEPTGSTSMTSTVFRNNVEDFVHNVQLVIDQDKQRTPKRKKLKEFNEMERRRKISESNKGKVPWNKGKRHSIETRELIKKRTLEALRDPKVRKKMVERPRAHSEQSKARIRFALKRAWQRRFKQMFMQQQCCLAWQEGIAEAARSGGIEQQELDWESYDKLKLEIIQSELQEKVVKEKAKEIARQQKAKDKAEKMVLLAQEQKMKKAKAKADQKRAQKETERKGSLLSRELVVMAKLPKVKKSLVATTDNGNATQGTQPAAEKWDLEFVKKNMRSGVSLADQIRAVKIQKAQSAASEIPKESSDEKAEI